MTNNFDEKIILKIEIEISTSLPLTASTGICSDFSLGRDIIAHYLLSKSYCCISGLHD
jgi:hypothetical protein